jgi:PAS domain S-box-containing protein
MEAKPQSENLTSDVRNDIEFDNIFNLEEIQRFQDLFSKATGVASIITHPDGTPITNPSNFCRLCSDVIRKTEKGLANCYKSDAIIGSLNPSGINVCKCLSGGLWDASAGITINGMHIANWLIGQVRSEELDLDTILQFAEEIGADKEEYLEALYQVPVMSFERFNDKAKMLFEFAEELSERGYNNLQLKKQVIERDKTVRLLRENEKYYLSIFENIQEVFYQTDLNGKILDISPSIKYFTEFNKYELIGTYVQDLYNNKEDRQKMLSTIVETGELRDFELTFKSKMGHIRHVSTNAHLILDIYGKPFQIVGAIRDITEHKLAEEALQESEMKYRELVDNSPDAIVIYIDGRIVFVNNECIRLFGASGSNELIGRSVMEFVHPDSRAIVIERMEIAKKERTLLPRIDEKYLRVDGSELDVEVKAMPIMIKNKPAVQLIIRDITERKRAKEALIESWQQLLNIIDFLPDATFVIDNDDKVIAWNKAIEEMTGVQKQDIIGKGDHIYATPFYGIKRNLFLDLIDIDNEELNTHYSNVVRNGNSLHAEIFAPALNEGKGAYISVLVAPLFNSNGERMGSIESIRDITDRKKAEKELVLLEKAIYTSGEAIFLTDREGIFTFVNPSFTALYGFSSEEIVGKVTPRIIKSGVLDRSVYDNFWVTLLKGDEVRGELINKNKDGTLIHIDESITPIFDEEKNIIGFLGIQRDISERKQAEQELITAKEKAEESDRLKTAFLNNISHEIRTPFNGILGFLSIIQDESITKNEKDVYFKFINQSADRLMNTINDLVEISQVQAGQIKLKVQQTNIINLTEELFELFEKKVEKNGLEFFIYNNIPQDVVYINTDSTKLKTILSNLIGNAIKFTKKGSIVLNINLTGDFFEFCVKDSGTGIAKSKQPFIFERFNQVDKSVTRQSEGLGLGLSITKSYVEVLGGNIWLESDEGKGSSFYFTIPNS